MWYFYYFIWWSSPAGLILRSLSNLNKLTNGGLIVFCNNQTHRLISQLHFEDFGGGEVIVDLPLIRQWRSSQHWIIWGHKTLPIFVQYIRLTAVRFEKHLAAGPEPKEEKHLRQHVPPTVIYCQFMFIGVFFLTAWSSISVEAMLFGYEVQISQRYNAVAPSSVQLLRLVDKLAMNVCLDLGWILNTYQRGGDSKLFKELSFPNTRPLH